MHMAYTGLIMSIRKFEYTEWYTHTQLGNQQSVYLNQARHTWSMYTWFSIYESIFVALISLCMSRSNAPVVTINMLQHEGKYTEGKTWRKYTRREIHEGKYTEGNVFPCHVCYMPWDQGIYL